VNRVKANVLTGRLLVIYQPDVSMDDIVAVIEKHLDDISKLCSWPKQAEKFNTDTIKQVFGSASGVFYRIFIALTGKYIRAAMAAFISAPLPTWP